MLYEKPSEAVSAKKKRRRCFSGAVESRLSGPTPARDLLSAYCVPHGVEYIDEVARRPHLAEQGHSREHFHLLVRDAVDAPQLFVLAEIFPRRDSRGRCFGAEQRLGTRIGEEEKFATIESEYFSEPRQNLVGRMTLARFEVPDVRG